MGLAFLIIGDKLQLLSERKVLKEHEYASMLDAAGLVQAARGEAQEIVSHAKAQAEQCRRQGYDEGWASAQQSHAEQVVSSALQVQHQLRALRETMARLVVKGVEQITSEVPSARLLESALERVDGMLRHESFITLRVAPSEEVAARQALAGMCARAHWAQAVAVQADPELREGDCVVETASGSLDIGLQAQINAIGRALQGLDGGGLH